MNKEQREEYAGILERLASDVNPHASRKLLELAAMLTDPATVISRWVEPPARGEEWTFPVVALVHHYLKPVLYEESWQLPDWLRPEVQSVLHNFLPEARP